MATNYGTQQQQQQQQQRRKTADPILTLHVPPSIVSIDPEGNDHHHDDCEQQTTTRTTTTPAGNRSSISAVCFLSSSSSSSSSSSNQQPNNQQQKNKNEKDDDDDDDDDENDDDSENDDEEELDLRCRHLSNNKSLSIFGSNVNNNNNNIDLLSGIILASCHTNGDAFLWDLGQRRMVASLYDDLDNNKNNNVNKKNQRNRRPRGPGITLRRLGDGGSTTTTTTSTTTTTTFSSNQQQQHQFLYHTRDSHGTVSIHDMSSNIITSSFETGSKTFCAASPCWGDANLVLLPTERETLVAVRDVRCSPWLSPAIGPFPAAAAAAGAGSNTAVDYLCENNDDGDGRRQQYGMVTSLAMAAAGGTAAATTTTATSSSDDTSGGCPRLVVACGMESGHVFFHDMAMPSHPLPKPQHCTTTNTCSQMIRLGMNPVLGLDLATSPSSISTSSSFSSSSLSNNHRYSVMAAAGMAGDAAELSELPKEEQGTVALLKATFPLLATSSSSLSSSSSSSSSSPNTMMNPTIRIRGRWSTCNIQNDMFGGKPGVAICRFRSDDNGRLVAVGGWDHRVRIYDRCAQKSLLPSSSSSNLSSSSSSSLLAILKGHSASVTAVDWAPTSCFYQHNKQQQHRQVSPRRGLLATGAGDGRIHIWNLS